MVSADLEQLQRWVRAGGTWQALSRGSGTAEGALLTCSGGEEMARLRSTDPELVAYVDGRASGGEHAGPARQ